MDSNGNIHFVKDKESLAELTAKHGKLTPVHLVDSVTKDTKNCRACPAFKLSASGSEVCTGGNRAMRRKVYKCRTRIKRQFGF